MRAIGVILAMGHPVTTFAAFAACGAVGLIYPVSTNEHQVVLPAYLLVLSVLAWGRWRWFRHNAGTMDAPRVLKAFIIANVPAALGLPLTVAFGMPVEGNVAGFILYPALALALLLIAPAVWLLGRRQIRRAQERPAFTSPSTNTRMAEDRLPDRP